MTNRWFVIRCGIMLLSVVAFVSTEAFVAAPSLSTFVPPAPWSSSLLAAASSSSPDPQSSWLDDYTDDEIQEMRSLILSLSMDHSDESRRSRLRGVFVDAFQRAGGGDSTPQRFASLFDRMVIKIGDEVQLEAKKKYFEANASRLEEPGTDEGDGSPAEGKGDAKEKSPDELQLWALVDMMVQSKTMVKKGLGEVQSSGDFQ